MTSSRAATKIMKRVDTIGWQAKKRDDVLCWRADGAGPGQQLCGSAPPRTGCPLTLCFSRRIHPHTAGATALPPMRRIRGALNAAGHHAPPALLIEVEAGPTVGAIALGFAAETEGVGARPAGVACQWQVRRAQPQKGHGTFGGARRGSPLEVGSEKLRSLSRP